MPRGSKLLCAPKYYKQQQHRDSYRIQLPISVYLEAPVRSLQHLSLRLDPAVPLQHGWVKVMASSNIIFTNLINGPSEKETVLIARIEQSLNWYMECNGYITKPTTLANAPNTIACLADVYNILQMVNPKKTTVCMGSGSTHEFSDVDVLPVDKGRVDHEIVRDENCELLILKNDASGRNNNTHQRCTKCSKFRIALRGRSYRLAKQQTDRCSISSRVPFSLLSKEELRSRALKLQKELGRIKMLHLRLRDKIEHSVKKHGVIIDDLQLGNDMKSILENESKVAQVKGTLTPFTKMFWEQQAEAVSKDSRGMRWHPLMIKWCIYLRHLSSNAYDTLRQSNCIVLPSQRTLRDYTYHIKPKSGFSDENDMQLIQLSKLNQCEEREKYVLLLIDEMHVREDLVYDKHSGKLIGLMNMGDINSQLMAFEKSLQGNDSEQLSHLANSVTTFMVKSLFSRLEFPYASFPCRDVTGDLLFDPLWEAVCRLERIGMKVMGTVSDGASVNRRLIRLHTQGLRLHHKTLNPFTEENRNFYFLSDPPHLIKTVRNCWASQHRNLWNDGKAIAWDHLEKLYANNRDEKGLVLLPKLRYEHLYLTSFAKMRVDLATQVLSESVSNALKKYGGPDAEETMHFTMMFDKFFDALNVSNFKGGKAQRKPFKNPYYSSNDQRLKWLEEDFLSYLTEWEKSVKTREGVYTKTQRSQMLLSKETMDGLKITTRSFVELVRFLFTIPGVTSFLSRKLCQDPLEKFFGCQRQIGGTNNNPNIKEFEQNTQMLRVANFCREVVKGNCRGNADLQVNNDRYSDTTLLPLPKRRRTSHYDSNLCEQKKKADLTEPYDVLIGIIEEMADNKIHQKTTLSITACTILEAAAHNSMVMHSFSLELFDNLSSCFVSCKSHQRQREKMWNNYHLLRISAEFKKKWKRFSDTCEIAIPPMFYQQLTHEFFKHVIQQKYKLEVADHMIENEAESCNRRLSLQEENILRYISGYVCRQLIHKLQKSADLDKGDLIFLLREWNNELEEDDLQENEDWLNIIDRGGLWHINNDAYELFYDIETALRRLLTTKDMERMDKLTMIQKVAEEDNVKFQLWLLVDDEKIGEKLLNKLLDLYITIRGHSFTSAFMERYKQVNKKALQRSKPLRTELCSNVL